MYPNKTLQTILRTLIVLLFAFLLFLVLTSIASCAHSKRIVNRSFYFWESEFNLGDSDTSNLTSLGVKKMYVRFFDVEPNHISVAVPKGAAWIGDCEKKNLEIVPVVFIENRVFYNVKDTFEIKDLVNKIDTKISRMSERLKNFAFNEYQFDCDWTENTKANYFYFLKQFKKRKRSVSATIRLWQLNDTDAAGVPPVNRGMLMVYNLSRPDQENEKNSIMETSELKKYLVHAKKYPIPLDAVFPLFSWGKIFRKGEFLGLVNDLSDEHLKDTASFQHQTKHGYVSKIDTVIGKLFLRSGDRIQIEAVDKSELNKAIDMVSSHLNSDSINIAFYHYDTLLLNRYGKEFLSKAYDRMH